MKLKDAVEEMGDAVGGTLYALERFNRALTKLGEVPEDQRWEVNEELAALGEQVRALEERVSETQSRAKRLRDAPDPYELPYAVRKLRGPE